MPSHTCHYAVQDLTALFFFEPMVSLLPTLSLELHLELFINISHFSQLEKSPCSILFLINTFMFVGEVECRFNIFISNQREVGGILISSANAIML